MSVQQNKAVSNTGCASDRPADPLGTPLSPGEVHFLWWFIQGSIMEPETRLRLRRAWGMCERHSVAALSAEAAFRQSYLHGPAILYADLMDRAARAFETARPLAGPRLARRLRLRGPCLMCGLELGPNSPGGFIPDERVAEGRDLSQMRSFMAESERHWRGTVCGICARTASAARCRAHLLLDLERNPAIELAPHRALVAQIGAHIDRYRVSFRWEQRGSATAEDRAALVSAVGWCSGWNALLGIL